MTKHKLPVLVACLLLSIYLFCGCDEAATSTPNRNTEFTGTLIYGQVMIDGVMYAPYFPYSHFTDNGWTCEEIDSAPEVQTIPAQTRYVDLYYTMTHEKIGRISIRLGNATNKELPITECDVEYIAVWQKDIEPGIHVETNAGVSFTTTKAEVDILANEFNEMKKADDTERYIRSIDDVKPRENDGQLIYRFGAGGWGSTLVVDADTDMVIGIHVVQNN